MRNLKSIYELLDEAEQRGVDSESLFVNPNDVFTLDSDNFHPEDADIEQETDEAED